MTMDDMLYNVSYSNIRLLNRAMPSYDDEKTGAQNTVTKKGGLTTADLFSRMKEIRKGI